MTDNEAHRRLSYNQLNDLKTLGRCTYRKNISLFIFYSEQKLHLFPAIWDREILYNLVTEITSNCFVKFATSPEFPANITTLGKIAILAVCAMCEYG